MANEGLQQVADCFRAAEKSNKLACDLMDRFVTECLKCNWKAAAAAHLAAVDAFDCVLVNIGAAYKRAESVALPKQ